MLKLQDDVSSHDASVHYTKSGSMKSARLVPSGGRYDNSRFTRDSRAAARRHLVRTACETLSRRNAAAAGKPGGRVLTRSQQALAPLPDRWTDRLPARRRRQWRPDRRLATRPLATRGQDVTRRVTRQSGRPAVSPAALRSGRRVKQKDFSYEEDHLLFIEEDDDDDASPPPRPAPSGAPPGRPRRTASVTPGCEPRTTSLAPPGRKPRTDSITPGRTLRSADASPAVRRVAPPGETQADCRLGSRRMSDVAPGAYEISCQIDFQCTVIAIRSRTVVTCLLLQCVVL